MNSTSNARLDNIILKGTKQESSDGVAAPTFSVPAGEVAYGTYVTMTAADGCVICYTLDGTDPAESATAETSATSVETIQITKDVTVRAIALDNEANSSSEAKATYTVKRPDAPTFTPAAGAVFAGTEVTIEAAGADMIMYTLNGEDPSFENTVGEEYTAPFIINEETTIKAIAIDANGFESTVATAKYTIKEVGNDQIDLRGITETLTFNPGAFSSTGSGYSSYEDVTFMGSDGKNYGGWNLENVMHSGEAMQMRKSDGKVTMPTILTDKGFTIKVTATANSVNVSDGTDTATDELTTELTSADITISAGSKYAVISSIEIIPTADIAVATPTFSVESGTYEEAQTVEIACETEDATIYYTLDGTEPTNESTKYAGAITVSETITIKAIAYNADGEASKVASATYTFPVVYENIAAFKEANTTGYLNLTGAQIVYIDNNKVNIYVRDASGATSLYKKEGFDVDFKTGDMLNGIIKATNGNFKNQPQLNNVDLTKLTVSGNEVVVAKVIDGTTEAIAANLCDLVKIENTTIIYSGTKYYVGEDNDIQLYDQFKAGLSFTADKTADVQGIAAVYNSTYELFPRFESDIVYLDNSVSVEIGAVGMATFSCDKALDFTGTDAIYAYTATIDGETVNFKRVRKVPAGTGLLLRNPLGESAVEAVNVPVIDDEDAEDVSDNAFVAALEEIASLPTEQDGTNYILNKVGGKLGFYKAAGKKVGAGKAYLKVPAGTTPNAVIAISFDGDVTTGILTIDHEQQSEASGAYDLQGRRVAQPTKGLYIVNGKKMIVK